MTTKGRRKIKPKTIMDVIPGSGGIISNIADSLGVDWHTAKKAIEENPAAKTALEDELEKRLDLSESVVIMNIQLAVKQQKKGFFADTSDAKWYLSKKGKKRDYSDKLGIEHSGSLTWSDFINAGNPDAKTNSK